jgi:uncharacterized membrane protein YcjF (UPF0283 family)
MFDVEEYILIASITILAALVSKLEKTDGVFLLTLFSFNIGSFSFTIIFVIFKMSTFFENNWYVFSFVFAMIILSLFCIIYLICKKTGWMWQLKKPQQRRKKVK